MNKKIMHRVLFFTRVNAEGKTKILKDEYKKLEEELDLLSSLMDHLALEATDEESFMFLHREFELLLDLYIRFQNSAIWKKILEEKTATDDGACSKEGQ